MSDIGMWGKLPDPSSIKTPAAILKEQAELLTEATKGLLQGKVVTSRADPNSLIFDSFFSQGKPMKRREFTVSLSVVVPALNGYTHEILRVNHDLMVYPADVLDAVGRENYIVVKEDELMAVLRKILSSKSTHAILASLSAQAGQ